MSENDFSNLNEEYLFVKLHAIIAQSLFDEKLESLIHTYSLEALKQVLQPMGISFIEHSKVQKQIYHSLFNQIERIFWHLPQGLKSYYQLTLGRLFLDNIKAVIRFSSTEKDLSKDFLQELLFDVPGYPKISFDANFRLNFEQGKLPLNWQKSLQKITQNLSPSVNIFFTEIQLDELYWSSLIEISQQMPAYFSKEISSFFGKLIDCKNVTVLFRNIQFYHLPADKLLSILSSHGQLLPFSTLQHLSTISQLNDLLTQLPPYFQIFNSSEIMDISTIEKKFNDRLFTELMCFFKDFNRPILSIIVFPLLKIIEMQNISRLYEGFYFNLSQEKLSKLITVKSN